MSTCCCGSHYPNPNPDYNIQVDNPAYFYNSHL